MGGFVIDLDSKSPNGAPISAEEATRLTLTPKGVQLLAECGYLPEISVEDIRDKSKADELSKLIACIQALWMVVEVCCRLYLKLPVSLLEVTTLGHVLCALILYTLWWHKPRWIQEPTRVEGEWLRSISAFMFMASEMSDSEAKQSLFGSRYNVRTSEISKLQYICAASATDSINSGPTKPLVMETAATTESEEQLGSTEKQSAMHGHFTTRGRVSNNKHDAQHDLENMAPADRELEEVARLRRDLAAAAVNEFPAIQKLLHAEWDPRERRYFDAMKIYPEMPKKFRHGSILEQNAKSLVCDTEHLVTDVASDWPSDGMLRATSRTTGGLMIGSFLWCASIAFAAVHVAAWKGAFPTNFEAWTWRASSVYIGFSGLVWLVIHILAEISESIWWFWFDLLSDEASKKSRFMIMAVCSICGVCYIFARIFLIVEAFVSLRSLPGAVFLVPSWALSVPHL